MANQSLETLYMFDQKAKHKRSTYSNINAAEQRIVSFNPFIATYDAALDNNTEFYINIKHLISFSSFKQVEYIQAWCQE